MGFVRTEVPDLLSGRMEYGSPSHSSILRGFIARIARRCRVLFLPDGNLSTLQTLGSIYSVCNFPSNLRALVDKRFARMLQSDVKHARIIERGGYKFYAAVAGTIGFQATFVLA